MITIENVKKYYDDVLALDIPKLHIDKGSVVILQGKSGSGKSSLLSLIAALSKPTEGKIVVDGENIALLADHFASDFRREHIGFIFQKYNLIPHLSVIQNIIIPMLPSDPEHKYLHKRLEDVMELFSIEHKKDMQVQKLSGGEQQRVAIARAMINNPELILADEPTANLDKKLSLEFINTLQELKSMGKTIVVATHDPLFLDLDFVDKIIALENGKVVV